MQTPIYIVGAGAIGMTLAVLLRQAGKNVVLLRSRPTSQAEADVLITVEFNDGTSQTARLPIGTLDDIDRLHGLVLLTNKSFGNAELARRLRGKTGDSPLILLQNGLAIEQPYLEAGFPQVYRCVLLATSQVRTPYMVSYKPVAASPVGVIRGDASGLAALVEQITTTDFPFRAEKNIQVAIWEKVVTNCVFNAICPLLGVDNGIFHRNASVLALAREVISECVVVAGEAGITLDSQAVEQRLLQISQRSDGQLISTLVDINQGRETEIGTLNLEVARLAHRLGKPELAIRTQLLGELTRLKAEASRSTTGG
ncbi:2-dehydropantoate 2-reductase [Fibrella aestuarina BUZ 2]|uniref:2-dehydropantoate 2-reductase n=1 Tax=Fibrella aestuarina BUZ 2 TaxID=1166018 RepID=I0KFG7_9BACT|nr:2-dehydropantoate 2-reductase [Fibrella aestuarina]CCH02870.1 2-dehydropantoate 2-reductase [Fibrella aestuarina BUZ 2]